MGLRRWIANNLQGDIYIWAVVFFLSIFGILAVYSSIGTLAYSKHSGNTEFYLFKQIGMLFLGLFIMWLSHLLDYRYYSRLSQVLLIISIPLLAYTLFFGSNVNEARRWIMIPWVGLTFQTSDLARLALIMYIARFLSKRQDSISDTKKTLYPIIGSIILVCGLIAPANLSTAMVLFLTCIVLLFIGRIPIKSLLGLTGIAIIIFGIILVVLFNMPGQGRVQTWKSRIENYRSQKDPAANYQNLQAKIAIANGEVFGLGPGRSKQRIFLPSPYADFIFAIILEEYGILGGLALIFLYLFFLFRCIKIVIKTPKAFGALLAVGLAFSLIIPAFINMGVAVNIFPVTGMSLPLVSMGGTSTLFTSLAIGIILSVSRYTEESIPETSEEGMKIETV
ncbi:MAG: FtsW/RodA/SpoVE family cell cycle protein [Flavobacteriales bacterium]|nr:FtsW/RodA/SpoVE family cell cycle protein [Flavobacteriales bacterium]